VGIEGPVLVASADAQARAVIVRVFTRDGYETSDVASGEETLASVKEDPPSIVLLDLELDDMSGYEVCHEIRQYSGDQLPIILLSGVRTEAPDRLVGILIGADDYVTKPFDPDELLARARRLLTRAPKPSPILDVQLTAREIQVLRMLANGSGQDRIARELFISPKTVGSHIQRILAKLGVHSRTEAVALAYREGLMGEARQPNKV